MSRSLKKWPSKFWIAAAVAFGIPSSLSFADSDAEQIVMLSKALYAENRYVLLCEDYPIKTKSPEDAIKPAKKYFSEDFLKRIVVGCQYEKHYRYSVRSDFLDGVSPSACQDNGDPKTLGWPCFHDYNFGKPAIKDGKAIIKVTYDKDANGQSAIFYTTLKLIKENGQWRIDDVALIDKNGDGGDYSESRPSIKAETDRDIQRALKKPN